MFIALASTKKAFFIAVAHAISLLCQLMFPLTYNGESENWPLLLCQKCSSSSPVPNK